MRGSLICFILCSAVLLDTSDCRPKSAFGPKRHSGNENDDDSSFGFLSKARSRVRYEGFSVGEGDIAVSDDEFAQRLEKQVTTWPDGRVYYDWHKSVSPQMRELFNLAMKEWEDHTCIAFARKDSPERLTFLKYRTDHEGCYSFVGRQAKDIIKGQDVNLGPGCENFHTAIHELAHALGLAHEQSRSDRDNYIVINWKNIDKTMRMQFDKQKTTNELEPYDYKSVMQYPSWGFSLKPYEKITMATKNPLYQYLMDEERQGLTFKDIKVINRLYNCADKCRENKDNGECENGGFLIPYKTKDKSICSCMCNNGFYGDRCENSHLKTGVPDYGLKEYGGLRCGGNVTKPGTIQTADFPVRSRIQPGCSWWIRAPVGQRVRIYFDTFAFLGPETIRGGKTLCMYEKVEIRTTDIFDPDIYCGTMLHRQTLTSAGRDLIIIIVPDISNTELYGFGMKATITFEEGGEKSMEDTGQIAIDKNEMDDLVRETNSQRKKVIPKGVKIMETRK